MEPDAMLTRRHLLGASSGLALASVHPAQAQTQFVRIGSGLAGTYPLFGAKMAEIINRAVPGARANTLPGPTEQNLVRVQRGEAELCLSYTFQTYQVAQGQGELRVPAPDLRHLMSTYGSYHMIVARQGANIETLGDVGRRPMRVWLGPRASVFWPLNTAALAAYNLTPEDITRAGGVVNTAGYQNLTQIFQDGQVDVAFFAGPAPLSLLLQLDRAPGFRMLGLTGDAVQRFEAALPGVGVREHPGGIYASVPNAVPAPYVFNHVAASARMPEELAYRITKALWENYREFHTLFPGGEEVNPQTAMAFNRVPVHPGAARYYREAGIPV
jgi:TRAP transporter TAXI family solute receptor